MYAFKGLVCEYAFRHIAGTGTQLQHYLGNIFKNSFLENFFIKYHLRQFCRFTEIDIEKLNPIFVYALLGYLYENADAEQWETFIFNELILPNDKHLPHNHRSSNIWDQFIFLCKQHFEQRPKIIFDKNEDQNIVKIQLSETSIGEHSSISFKYAKKKAIHLAMKWVATILEEKLNQDKIYKANQILLQQEKAKTILEAKTEKQRKHIARNESHAERMKEKQKLAEQKAQAEDHKRREAKQGVKEKSTKKGKDTIYRVYTAEEIATMSNAKRRNLQDRGILPKNIV